MQFGPETASPVSAITALSLSDSACAAGSSDSPKPDDITVALRAPCAGARKVSGTSGRRDHHHHVVGRLRQLIEGR